MSDKSRSGRIRPMTATEYDEHTYHVHTRGYSVIPDFLDPGDCLELKRGLTRALDSYEVCDTEQSVLDQCLIHDLLCQDIMFGRLLEDRRLQHLLAPLLGDYWVMYAFTSSSLPPRGNNYGSRVHVDSPRLVPGYPFNIGVIWALDDFSVENGATQVLPGSQHSSDAPTADMFAHNCIQLTCRPGSLIVFHARLYHRAGDNQTDAWRHSLTMNACRPFMKQRMDWVRFIPTSISNALNEQARRIIGFDTRVPTSLDEFFVPDAQRLYKPNQG